MTGFFLCRCITDKGNPWLSGHLFRYFFHEGKAVRIYDAASEQVKFTCCGDEPYNEKDYEFVKGSDWLTHEAFCLYREADKFKPYEKHLVL